MQNVQGGSGGLGRAKVLEPFFWILDHVRLSKSAVIKKSVKRPIGGANNMKFYAVLSHLAKCCNLRIYCQKSRGGQFGQCQYLDNFFENKNCHPIFEGTLCRRHMRKLQPQGIHQYMKVRTMWSPGDPLQAPMDVRSEIQGLFVS